MIYSIKHGDREIKVIAGSREVAEQFVQSHYGEPMIMVIKQRRKAVETAASLETETTTVFPADDLELDDGIPEE
jgi:hypothetical protein